MHSGGPAGSTANFTDACGLAGAGVLGDDFRTAFEHDGGVFGADFRTGVVLPLTALGKTGSIVRARLDLVIGI